MDLNADGFIDILTGQYNPGIVTWFKGTKKGFLDGVVLAEDINPKADDQWYSACSFGDIDSDGDFDMVVGGSGGLRVNFNTGTKEAPRFGKRIHLKTPEGEFLKIVPSYKMTLEQKKEEAERNKKMGRTMVRNPSGTMKTSPLLADWDSDGKLDILVGDSYMAKGQRGVTFFKGQNNGTFLQGAPLISETEKWLPGVAPRVFATDWNNDGVLDLLIGTSVATVDGKYVPQLNTGFEKDFGLESGPGKDESESAETKWSKPNAIIAGKDFRHIGVVYLLLGKSRN